MRIESKMVRSISPIRSMFEKTMAVTIWNENVRQTFVKVTSLIQIISKKKA